MSPRHARLGAFALLIILVLVFPLLVSLFSSLTAGAGEPPRAPTVQIAQATRDTSTPGATLTPPAPPTPSATLTSTLLPTPVSTSTSTATLAPSPTLTAPPTAGCPPPATPEPLWVDPVVSPTNALSQKISVTLGRGRELSISGPAGTVTLQGDFSTAQPVVLEVPLATNTTNELVVSGLVEYAPGCTYRLQTRTDRTGKPLSIIQQATTPTAFASLPVYLQPFSQVFAMGQPGPNPPGDVWLYQGSNDLFSVLSQDQYNAHLQSVDGTLSFWALLANVSGEQPPPPAYDYSVRGQTAQFGSSQVFACEASNRPALAFGKCTSLQNVDEAALVARVVVNGSALYLVEIGGTQYWVSANVIVM